MDIKNAMKLYLVTDTSWSTEATFMIHIEDALEGGITCLQLREKGLDHDAFVEKAEKVKNLAQKFNVPFIINDNIDVAVQIGADGVHIGQGDVSVRQAREALGPDKIIGVTCKTVEQALRAEAESADYIGSGAVFGSITKSDTSRLDHKILDDICKAISIPVVAIGGINEENILELQGTGVDGAAVVSSILSKDDKKLAAKELLKLSTKMIKHEMPKVLTIAGSDCSGGAGIQADLKTMAAHGCYGMSVITALTAQNTTGVFGVENCSDDFVKLQLDSVFSDIEPNAIKIGMVSSKEIIDVLADSLRNQKAKGSPDMEIVLDPVMVSTSGSKLLEDEAVEALMKELIPLATVITPNLSEAELLSGKKIKTTDDMIEAAKEIEKHYGGHILIKGGHLDEHANDLLYSDGKTYWYEGAKVDNPNTHGTGCTLSSAIASNLANGYSLPVSIKKSKAYLTGAIADKMDLGRGRGPLNHMYRR